MKKSMKILIKVLAAVGLLYCFLVSIGLMGAAFKGFGKDFAHTLIETTSNPYVGLFIGIFATSLVQSSSTTTSIVVGMVASNVLTIPNAIPIVMGTNIGTTSTAILASFATGNISAVTIAFVHFLFNLTGTAGIYPIKFFRAIPINLAKSFGDIAARKRRYAFVYVLGAFFLLPGLLILISRLLK